LSLYDRLVAEITRRNLLRPARPGGGRGDGYEDSLRRRIVLARQRLEQKRGDAERLRKRREELSSLVAESERRLSVASLFTPLEEVASAQGKLSAALYLLALVPEEGSAGGDRFDAGRQAASEVLDGAREEAERRLAAAERAHARVRAEIEELERGGEPVNLSVRYGPCEGLLDRLDGARRALADAREYASAVHRVRALESEPITVMSGEE
jgi:chromosome segregation ATPase